MDKISDERVLAYIKSTELSEDELIKVSGGRNSLATHRSSVKGTGDISSPDVLYDQVFDW